MARSFTFRLQKVLELREQRERLLQRQYMELLAQAEKEQRDLMDMLQRQHEYREQLTARQRGSLEVDEVMNYLSYLEHLAEAIVEQEQRVREAEERAEEARQDLIKASQEKKAVEKLKEKQYEDYLKAQQRAEIIFLDEVSSARFNRIQTDTGGSNGRRTAPGG